MRRGLMKWREDELSTAELADRVARMRAAMAAAGLDAFLAYTTLVRPAAVHYLTGFTPYWSDGLLLITGEGRPTFVTALSKRVGNWLAGVNPTCDIAHAPSPGRKIAEVLAERNIRRIGVLEPDMMPGALVSDLLNGSDIELVDASALFAKIRSVPTEGEARLARRAQSIALAAFEGLDAGATTVGEIVGPLELSVRNAGAEECYIATAPDLARATLLGRHHGSTPLGDVFAVRVSVAYNGVWTRLTRTLRKGEAYARTRFGQIEDMIATLDPARPIEGQIKAYEGSLKIGSWMLEAPLGTRPLARIAHPADDGARTVPYGVLTLRGEEGGAPFVHSDLVLPGAQSPAKAA